MNKTHFYLSIVSHGHDRLLFNNLKLAQLAKRDDVTVVVLDNVKSPSLKDHCNQNGFNYLSNEIPEGFGKNNNAVFQHCRENHSLHDDDNFIVMNPDVIINESEFEKLVQFTDEKNPHLFSINLFLDKEFTKFDENVRYFPTWLAYFKSFLLKIGYSYDKSIIHNPLQVDWASASFLGFRGELFKQLNGFDESFYMYCEDIDICARAKSMGANCLYIPTIKAHHLVQQENRNIFSRHFWWHLKSIWRYFNKAKTGY